MSEDLTEDRVPFIDGPTGKTLELVTRTFVQGPYEGDEPTALAGPRPGAFQRALSDAMDPSISDAEFDDKWQVPDGQVVTVRLAVESARRWAARRDLSADVRLRRMWTVLTTALEGR